MKNDLLMNFSVDKDNRKIRVQREFAASLEKVWAAWTQSDILDQWWAPKPYRTQTKSMDFSEGGFWLYAMVGPQGDTHWARADYKSIETLKKYSALDAFCDENGKINEDFPRSLWSNSFSGNGPSTTVNIEIEYKQPADLEKILELGFREGFTAAMQNLDALFG